MHYLQNKILISTTLISLFLVGCNSETKQERPENINEEKPATLDIEQSIELNRSYIRADQQLIKRHIKARGLDMKVTGTGLWYQIIREGDGELCKAEDKVSIRYQINDLLNGEIYYDSDLDGEKTFELGQGGVESGLEEGMLLLRRNSQAMFIMPPSLAYGLSGDGDKIPPRAILIYEVTVLAVN